MVPMSNTVRKQMTTTVPAVAYSFCLDRLIGLAMPNVISSF